MPVRSADVRLLPLTRQPLLWGALAFAAGATFSIHHWRPPLWWLLAALIFFTAALRFQRVTFGYANSLACLAALGALAIQVHPFAHVPEEIPQPIASLIDSREEIVITGHLLRDPEARASRTVAEIETESLTASGISANSGQKVRVNFYQKQNRDPEAEVTEDAVALRPLRYGDRIQFSAHLRRPRNYRNPGDFDYRGFLAWQDIRLLGSSDVATLTKLEGTSGTRLGYWRAATRRALEQRIHGLWPTPDAGVIAAMLLGDKFGLDRETTVDFQRTGAYHVLVVAGLKVGVIALTLMGLLSLLRVPQWLASSGTIAVCSSYAYLTNANPPVVRATIMLGLFLLARFLFRPSAQLNAVGAAALAMLTIDPGALFDASFQLTFLAMLAIAGVAAPIIDATSHQLRRGLRHLDSLDYDATLPPKLAQLRLDLRLVAERCARIVRGKISPTRCGLAMAFMLRACAAVFDTLVVSTALQLALALPMAWYFHRAVMVGVPANAIVVPLHALLLPVGFLAVGAAFASVRLASPFAHITSWLLHGTTTTVSWLAHLRLADARVATPPISAAVAIGLTLAIATIAIYRISSSRRFALAGIVALAGCALWITTVAPRPNITHGVLEITALDVGQGDAILVITPQGKTLLVDAGGYPEFLHSEFDTGEDVVAPYLWSRGITHLDALALTHAHADHIGGMPSVLRDFSPRELWLGVDPPTKPYLALLALAEVENMEVRHFAAGETINFGGAEFRVLAPPRDWELKEQPRNNDSLALLVRNGNTSALLAGDVEKKIESFITGEAPHADVLKVAHHGSASSSTPEFLDAVHPQFAVISSGALNPYGHPRREVLARLQERHIATWRIDTLGATTFILDGKQVRVHTDVTP